MERRFNVKVMPGARKNLWKEENGLIKVYLTAPAVDNKANEALIKFAAAHLGVRPSTISIIKGLHSRQKTIAISD